MRIAPLLLLAACTTKKITAEPDAQGPRIDAASIDGATVPDASPPDGSIPTGGYTLTMVTCPAPNDAGQRFAILAAPGKLIADLVGVIACLHFSSFAFPNGATMACGLDGTIVKDGEVGAYCPQGADYVLFGMPK